MVVIQTLTGENTYLLTMAERELAQDFIAKYGVHGLEKVDAETFEPRNLHGLLHGASLFTPQRLIFLHGAAKNKALWEALPDWLEKVPPDTSLVIVEPTIDKRTKTYKVLKNKTDFREFTVLSGTELKKWVQKVVQKQGSHITPQNIDYFVQRVGPDQWRLAQEVEKLSVYPEITQLLIQSLVEPSAEGSAFELLDAALAGDIQKTAKLVANLKTEEDPYKLFGLLASQVYALAVVVHAGSRTSDAIAKETGLHPFVVRKTASAHFNLLQVKQIVETVAVCDVQLKSTGAAPWFLLEGALQKITNIVK